MRAAIRFATLAAAMAATFAGIPAGPASGQPTNLQVNDPAGVPAGNTDITPSVAAIGNKVLIVWMVFGTVPTQRVRAAFSEDGGATYTDVGWLPALTGDWRWGADALVEADPVTNTFFIAAQSTSNATHEAGIAFVTAQIGAGIQWGTPRIVYPHAVPGGTYYIDSFDMHYDASSGWLNLVFRNGWLDPPPLVHLFSADRGATWSPPTTVQSLPGFTSASPRIAWSYFGPLLTYIDRPGYEHGTLYSRPWSGGFQPPVTIASFRMDGATLPGTTTDFGIGDAPTIAVDRTIYRYQGTVYAAWVASCAFPTWPTPSGTPFVETEPNDTSAQPNVVPANTGWINGQFSPASEPDYLRLHLEQYQRLIVRATSIAPTCTDCDPTVQIEVMAPNGTDGLGVTPLPQSRMANTETAVLFTPKSSGDYYLRITGDGVSAYQLSLAFSSIANPGLDRRDIWLSTSQNGGTTWSTPSLIGFEQPGYDVANLKMIVANDGRPYLFWQDWSADEFARLMCVRVTRSSDGGHLWEVPHTISTATTNWQAVTLFGAFEVGWRLGAATTPMVVDELAKTTDPAAPASASRVAHAAAVLPEDRVHVAWTDGRLGQGDIFTTNFLTGFEVDYRTADTVATPGEYLGLRMALVNKNTLFSQWVDTFTPTCNRNWSSFYGSMTFGPGESASTSPYVVQVPDTAAAGTVFFQGGIDVGPESYGINTFIHVQPSVGVQEGASVLAFRAPNPNPASSYTNFGFTLPTADQVLLEVYDLRGARVRTLLSGRREGGSQRQGWDLRDDSGRPVANGIYLSRLTVGASSQTRRIAVMH